MVVGSCNSQINILQENLQNCIITSEFTMYCWSFFWDVQIFVPIIQQIMCSTQCPQVCYPPRSLASKAHQVSDSGFRLQGRDMGKATHSFCIMWILQQDDMGQASFYIRMRKLSRVKILTTTRGLLRMMAWLQGLALTALICAVHPCHLVANRFPPPSHLA